MENLLLKQISSFPPTDLFSFAVFQESFFCCSRPQIFSASLCFKSHSSAVKSAGELCFFGMSFSVCEEIPPKAPKIKSETPAALPLEPIGAKASNFQNILFQGR